jgi:hypothetical protein
MKVTRENIIDHLVDYQLNLINVKLTPKERSLGEWYNKYTLSEEQKKEFEKYAISLLKKVFKFNTTKAKDTFNWFLTTYGLK